MVELDPAHGGQIVRADWQGLPALAPGQAGRAAADQHGGCFPLVPFSNRIRDAAFRFLGREIHLPPPEYMEPHALHGTGWRTSWSAEASGPGNARMWFEHPRGPWPWRYRAEQTVSLEAGQLHISLSILNLDSEPMPAGIGLHPYFVRPQGLWLNAHTGGRWATLTGETGLPHARDAAPEDLGAPGHDHCFFGWDRRAEFGGADGLAVSITASPALGNLVIYTPPDEAYFCLEPVSHVNNAVNMDALAQAEQMAVLAPGEQLQGAMTISVRPA
ncbi:aldose 1-epimerase [Hyphomonas sp.]|uniref:aldose 1-epimerase n=1 Tax=Hyphomonas sp. TaxID=87 RepID=UPI0025BB5DE2|nr:aldose 1-epimerase [Hyphomonas sp.]